MEVGSAPTFLVRVFAILRMLSCFRDAAGNRDRKAELHKHPAGSCRVCCIERLAELRIIENRLLKVN